MHICHLRLHVKQVTNQSNPTKFYNLKSGGGQEDNSERLITPAIVNYKNWQEKCLDSHCWLLSVNGIW